MVVKDKRVTSKPLNKSSGVPGATGRQGQGGQGQAAAVDSNKKLIVCCAATAAARAATRIFAARSSREAEAVPEAEDVIDLGAPVVPRRARCSPHRHRRGERGTRARGAKGVRGARDERGRGTRGARASASSRIPYTPNPRLYPGPTARQKQNTRLKGESGRKLRARRKRVFQRPVPNARLYRPAPPRPPPPPPPPPARPRVSWPLPTHPRALDTASRAALRLSERRPVGTPSPPPPALPLAPRSRHLVVTLPSASASAAAGGDAPQPRVRSRTSPPRPPRHRALMDPANRHSTSPEDCSDGNDTLSAPSEFLAEFLSAIMQRQYAEALKYCRLILQYEPHNATARGFYPLLQHKLQAHGQQEGPTTATGAAGVAGAAGAAGERAASGRSRWLRRGSSRQEVMGARVGGAEEMQQGDDSDSDSERSDCGSQSSLELDSDAPAAPAPAPVPDHSLDLSHSHNQSRRTDPTDSASGSSGASSRTSGGSSGSGGCWESSGSASRSDADDNGNALASGTGVDEDEADVENDNASASLRRLRAQFACSIK